MFNKQYILDLFKRTWPKANSEHIKLFLSEGGGISAFECTLLYLHIIKNKPSKIIEFSPNHGYSTSAIAFAQQINNKPGAFATFELNHSAFCATKKRIHDSKLLQFCEIIEGNALIEVPKWINAQKNCEVDLCFIDSDHGEEFANKYVSGIFPLLSKDCLICVHDICATERSDNGKAPFKTSLMAGCFKGGEENTIRRYISDREYCALHSITGGKHEGANLPVNVELYSEIEKITGFNFLKAKGKACPKSILFRKL